MAETVCDKCCRTYQIYLLWPVVRQGLRTSQVSEIVALMKRYYCYRLCNDDFNRKSYPAQKLVKFENTNRLKKSYYQRNYIQKHTKTRKCRVQQLKTNFHVTSDKSVKGTAFSFYPTVLVNQCLYLPSQQTQLFTH